jgi:hypothetical protein
LVKCQVFVETGTNVGSTVAYVARRFPDLHCFSCEPDRRAYDEAQKNTSHYDNVTLYNEPSQHFLRRLLEKKEVLHREVLFWIDAHGYGFQWPLREEIRLITSRRDKAFVLIDDFRVPGLDGFRYDAYDGQVCSLDYIKDSLDQRHTYRVYYPAYTDQTSGHHPLTGWGLIEFGHVSELDLKGGLRTNIRKEPTPL